MQKYCILFLNFWWIWASVIPKAIGVSFPACTLPFNKGETVSAYPPLSKPGTLSLPQNGSSTSWVKNKAAFPVWRVLGYSDESSILYKEWKLSWENLSLPSHNTAVRGKADSCIWTQCEYSVLLWKARSCKWSELSNIIPLEFLLP